MANPHPFAILKQKKPDSGIPHVSLAQRDLVLEGAGAIQDRTKEHLGYTDRPIIAARDPDAADLPALPTAGRYDNLATIDTVSSHDDWRTGWIAKHLDRRRASSWAAGIQAEKLADELA